MLFKHRPLFLTLVAAVIFSVGLFPQLPSWWLLAIPAVIMLLMIYRRHWHLVCLVLALIYGIVYGKCLLARQLPIHLDTQSFRLIGVVKGLPQHDALKQRFQLELEHLYPLDNQQIVHSVDGLIRLSWYYPSGHRHQNIEPGQRWQLEVKLRRPRGFVNPGGFDYQSHLMSQGIVATGYVKPSKFNALLAPKAHSAHIDHWRNYFKSQFIDWHQREKILGLLLALSIGERSLITVEQWQLLRDTGTVHLMAISGLHISLAAVIGFFSGLLCSRLYQLCFPLSIASYHFPALFSMAAALLYGLLAGMSLPTQRALIMVLIFHLAHMLYRNVSPWLLLSIALVTIAIHDPLAIYNQGFWLSFLAVAVLLYGFMGRLTLISSNHAECRAQSTTSEKSILSLKNTQILIEQYLKSILWSQWLLTIGLLVPSLFWLQGVSISAPLANIIAVPYVSLLIVPLLLLTMTMDTVVPPWADDIYQFTEQALECLVNILWLINQSLPDFISLPVGQLPWITLLIAGIAVIWLLSPRGIPYRYLSLLMLLPIAFPNREEFDLSLTFLDVGQGTAVIVETQNNVLVYDTGPTFGPRFNAGAHIIAPYLRYRGYVAIDHLIVSHADKDHAGGVNGLIDTVTVDHISSGEALPINQSVASCHRGQYWQWDNVHFSILWPPVDMIKLRKRESKDVRLGNNASCVLLIEYNDHKIILPGDIEDEVERQLLATDLLPEDIDILLVPHHGSLSSSLSAWVNQLSPEWAVVTAGYNNRYRHPHKTVSDRYLWQQATLLNTANQGAIQFTIDRENNWRVVSWRQKHRRYWYMQ